MVRLTTQGRQITTHPTNQQNAGVIIVHLKIVCRPGDPGCGQFLVSSIHQEEITLVGSGETADTVPVEDIS